jgi:hypothetical protein
VPDPKPAPLLGRLAVHLKMISMDQLAEAVRAQGRAGEEAKLGEILVELGFIDRAQHAKLLAAQQQVIAKQKGKPAAAAVRSVAAPTPPPAAAPVAAPAASAGPDPIGSATDFAVPTDSDRARFEAILRSAIAQGASDVHLHEGAQVRIRVAGRLEPHEQKMLEPEAAERMVLSFLCDAQREALAARGELDVCHTFPGIGRFRANLYRGLRGLDGVFRFITAEPPTLEQLGLPARLAKFTS